MTGKKLSRREFKNLVQKLIEDYNSPDAESELKSLPPKRLISALTPLLLSQYETTVQAAISAIGSATAQVAEDDLEAARIIIRRHIWNLMEESGNCPTGSPEVIGACLAEHRKLAEEYASILISFIMPDGNFLDHEPLLISALRGIERLADAHSELAADAVTYLQPLTKHHDRQIASKANQILETHFM